MPFAQREIAERELVGAEPADDGVEEHRAGDREIGAARIHAGRGQALFDVRFDQVLAQTMQRLGADAAVAQVLGRLAVVGRGRRAIRPRLRIVPEVPMTRSKPLLTI